jgi:hypothetical protein
VGNAQELNRTVHVFAHLQQLSKGLLVSPSRTSHLVSSSAKTSPLICIVWKVDGKRASYSAICIFLSVELPSNASKPFHAGNPV